METRYNVRIEAINDFLKFLQWANENNLDWECGRPIEKKDWKYIKDKVCIFWHVDEKFVGFETCLSVTFNCKNIRYITLTDIDEFLRNVSINKNK